MENERGAGEDAGAEESSRSGEEGHERMAAVWTKEISAAIRCVKILRN